VIVLALALAGRDPLLGGAVALLGADVVALDVIRARPGAVLVLCAAGLLTLGELASLSASLRAVDLLSRRLAARRAVYLVCVAAGGAAVAALVELATHIAIGGGLVSAAIGVGATIVLLGLTSALALARERSGGGAAGEAGESEAAGPGS
jgi:hypothetical protein